MASIALIAALPREIAGLVRSVSHGVRPDPALVARGIHLYQLPGAIVIAAGVGRERAALAVEAALAAAPITELISIGLAGSCTPGLTVGTVVEATHVVDVRTGERYTSAQLAGPPQRQILLATTSDIASVQEKQRLHAAYQASLVDMEAATVARLALAHGLRFRAIKAVSDAHDFELAGLNHFTGKGGTFRTGAFALHTALHPTTWTAAMQLGRNSTAALKALDDHLGELITSASSTAPPADAPRHESHSR